MVVAMAAGASVLVVAVVICVCRRPAQPRSKFDWGPAFSQQSHTHMCNTFHSHLYTDCEEQIEGLVQNYSNYLILYNRLKWFCTKSSNILSLVKYAEYMWRSLAIGIINYLLWNYYPIINMKKKRILFWEKFLLGMDVRDFLFP